MLRDPDLEVRTEALLYLTEHGNVDPLASIEAVGDFEDFSMRASMVAVPGPARPRAERRRGAADARRRWWRRRGPAGTRTRLEAARLLSFLPDLFDRELRELLQDEDVEVAKAAILAASAG